MIAAAAKSGGDLSTAAIRSLQAAREQRLAVLLAALLRRYVEGDEAGFKVHKGGWCFPRLELLFC